MGLGNLPTYQPNPELWDHIEAELEKEKNPRLIFWRWTSGIAATVALFLAIQYLLKEPAPEAHQIELMEMAQNSKWDKAQQDQKESQTPAAPSLAKAEKTPTTGPNDGKADPNLYADSSTYQSIVFATDSISVQTFTYDVTTANACATAPETQNTYNWNFGDAAVGSGTVAHGYSNPGTFKVKLKSNVNQDRRLDNMDAPIDEPDYDFKDLVDNEAIAEEPEYYEPPAVDKLGKSGLVQNGFRNNSGFYKSDFSTEKYFPLIENDYEDPTKDPLSTFGIDVDNASYAVMRTKINSQQIVPKDAVRIEEFVNYFDYEYSSPKGDRPFSVNLEAADCPWNKKHQLVRIGLKGKDIDYKNIQNSNLVFLIDVSGSMSDENKLPLVKKSLKLLVDQMGKDDRIAIVTYAGAAGLALPSTRCDEKEFIKKKIDKLDAGGSTAGGEGIKLAYKVAYENLIKEGNNRVILCTDGDFNVGQSSDSDMKNLIIENRNKGIFITACGFGMGNYQDSKMETIADNGNGNYFYIDTYRESEKVFEREMRATLFTIAKDVKIQVEFNPAHVKAYRLIGYENRKMPPQDFNDDTKDGGELGAGHTVTALYEIIPAGSDEEIPGSLELKYQQPNQTTTSTFSNEMLTVKLRYKKPNGNVSWLIEESLPSGSKSFATASSDFRFAAGTALFAQQLRQSKYVSQKDFSLARDILVKSKGTDPNGDRQELITILDKASNLYQTYSKQD